MEEPAKKPRRLSFMEGQGKVPDDFDTFMHMQDELPRYSTPWAMAVNSPGLILTSEPGDPDQRVQVSAEEFRGKFKDER